MTPDLDPEQNETVFIMHRTFGRFSGRGIQKINWHLEIIFKVTYVEISGPFICENYWKKIYLEIIFYRYQLELFKTLIA